MQVQILRSGAWNDLFYTGQASPEVVNEIEAERIFEFRAPYLRLSVYDIDGTLRPGGTSEIRYGDTVRALSNSVEVFRGTVDNRIGFDPATGQINFAVVGYLAQLKTVQMGRPIVRNPADPFGDEQAPHRYRKKVRERIDNSDNSEEGREELDWEYIALPYTYEVMWADRPGHRLGYEKVSIFDTLPSVNGAPFSSEATSRHYRSFDADGVVLPSGVFRRLLIEGIPLLVAVGDVVAEIVKQMNLTYPDSYASTISIDPFERQITVALENEEQFTQIQFQPSTLPGADENNLYVLGWRSGGVVIARTQNSVDWTEKASLEFPDPPDTFVDEPTTKRRNYISLGDDRYVVYSGWSVWLFSPDDPYFGRNVGRYDYIIVQFETGRIEDSGTIQWDDESIQAFIATSISYKVDRRYGDGRLSLQISEDDPPVVSEIRLSDGDLYFSFDGVPYFSGIVPVDRLAFTFDNATAGDVLLELAKLTNSFLFVGVDANGTRRIFLVSRGYYSSTVVLDGSEILSRRQTIANFDGDRIPALRGEIISNEDYNRALRQYYDDVYFPAEEEEWELELLNTPATAVIKPLDAIWFPDVPQIANGVPLVVQRIAINDDRITVMARRAR